MYKMNRNYNWAQSQFTVIGVQSLKILFLCLEPLCNIGFGWQTAPFSFHRIGSHTAILMKHYACRNLPVPTYSVPWFCQLRQVSAVEPLPAFLCPVLTLQAWMPDARKNKGEERGGEQQSGHWLCWKLFKAAGIQWKICVIFDCMSWANYPINFSMSYLDGGNLNVASLDVEVDDGVIVEVEPPRPKRKLIATLKVGLSETESCPK